MASTPSPLKNAWNAWRESGGVGLRRLILAATALHLVLAIGIFAAGRMHLAPAFVDRDGIMPSFAFDSYDYQRGAIELAATLRHGNFLTWARAGQPAHVKLISMSFAILGPLLGYGPISAEPFNLLCYLALVVLVFALGKEVASPRVGLCAAATIALWPTILLHSLQLLKDPLLIAGAVGVVLCATTLLTQVYNWHRGVMLGAITAVAVILVGVIRFQFVILVLVLLLLTLTLLFLRQALERRLLLWNLASALPAMVVACIFIAQQPSHNWEVLKRSSTDSGEPKLAAPQNLLVRGVVSYLPHDRKRASNSNLAWGRARLDFVALRLSGIRSRFVAAYPDAGSVIDRDFDFRDLRGMISYLPRAFAIGCWAPFPNTWISAGRRVGGFGKVLAGIETSLIYVCELLALLAIVSSPTQLSRWLLLLTASFGATGLGLLIPNVGALYRFRYPLWVLVIILGIEGGQSIISAVRLRSRRNGTMPDLDCGDLSPLDFQRSNG